ncbi:hypothetical protein Poly41_60630 [Novipirellula artificiosorum]|uniref:Uncharacterized protein n=1 Tax=Novipirellula artificiosorum TaxID=2528016 RepID=A0A5C6D4X9_9BACT|nr:hypothetical protein Poly41_60630 [Novipirellula artificiosorum]
MLVNTIARGHVKATVNSVPFALNRYATYESPLAKSRWDEGVTEFSIDDMTLRLDARDQDRLHPLLERFKIFLDCR